MDKAEKERAENNEDADVLVHKLDYMLGVFTVLLRAGATLEYDSGQTSPHLSACESAWWSNPSSHTGRAFSQLLKERVSLVGEALCTAAKSWSSWKVERLVRIFGSRSGDVNEALVSAVRAMVHCSCASGVLTYSDIHQVNSGAESRAEEDAQMDVMRILVNAGAKPPYRKALLAAIRGGCGVRVVTYLVDLGADIHTCARTFSDSDCALHLAIEHGAPGVTEYLMGAGADVNRQDRWGRTPLHVVPSSRVGREEYIARVRALLDAGANTFDVKDKSGETPLGCHIGNWESNKSITPVEVIQMLVEAGADPWLSNRPLLHLAAARLQVEVVPFLLSIGADANATDRRGETALHKVYCNDDLTRLPTVIEQLLNSGSRADIAMARDRSGDTPLHLLCGLPYNLPNYASSLDPLVEAIRLLAAAMPNINAQNNHGSTPVHVAACAGASELESYKRGPALQSGITLIIRTLVALGADIHSRDNNGSTPLQLAALSGNFLVVEKLFQPVSSPAPPDAMGRSLLHYVACSPFSLPPPESSSALQILSNLDMNVRDHQGMTPLHWAARCHSDLSNIQTIVAAGADIDARDSEGRTPLHHAARFSTPRITKQLLKMGAAPKPLDRCGNTPLSLAIRAGSLLGIMKLLEAGVCVSDDDIHVRLLVFLCSNTDSRVKNQVRR